MYQWLLDQQITKLYSLHPMVPKQIKGTPKEYRSISGSTSGFDFFSTSGSISGAELNFGRQNI